MPEIIDGSVGTEPVGLEPVAVGVLRTVYGQKRIKVSGIGNKILINQSGKISKIKMNQSGKI
jgi:hypothetical protein